MNTLLYFEEYESPLSHELFKRSNINLVILRTNKNLKYFNEEYLKATQKRNVYIADYYNNIEDEVKKFQKWCLEKNIVVNKFLNDSEYYLEYSNEFAELLGLKSLTKEQTAWVRDKVKMKEKFNDIGLQTVRFAPVETKQDILDFFNSNNQNPIVFKPRKGMNSIQTYKIEKAQDIEDLNIDFKPGKYMVENFCFDHEWSIESIIQDGIVLDSYLTYIPNATIWASISNNLNCHMTVPTIPSYFKFKPKQFIQQIVSGMNLKDGVMTIEVFISNDGNVKSSELGWRLPGCQATTNHSISYGIDIYNILIDLALGKKVELKYRNKIISVGDLYLPNKEGIISYITPFSELMTLDGVIDGEMFAKVGKFQKKRRVGNDASGWVQVLGVDEKDTLNKMKNIFDVFEIYTTDEKEMKGHKYVKKI